MAAVVFNLDHSAAAAAVGRSKDAIEKSSDGRGRFSFPFLCNIATQTQTRCPPIPFHAVGLQCLSVMEKSIDSTHDRACRE